VFATPFNGPQVYERERMANAGVLLNLSQP